MKLDHPCPEDISGLRSLWQEAFGDDDAFLDRFFSRAYAPRRSLCIRDGETPVCALYWFECALSDRKIAYLYALATKESHRGRGLARRVTGSALALLKEQGYSGALLVPGEPELFAMYEKLGFSAATYVSALSCTAGREAAALREVSVQEYAALRRSLLPPGGVVQEGENLDFLCGYARFYAGEDFLLAADDSDPLAGLELLGNKQNAPGILRALGKTAGAFRVPGSDIPFAMYCPLDGGPAPGYFGLAFD